jgi:hypothetical protein
VEYAKILTPAVLASSAEGSENTVKLPSRCATFSSSLGRISMRLFGAFCLPVGLCLAIFGCGSSGESGNSPSPDSAFAARFDSAAAIGDETERENAFAQLATDAAKAGDVDAARKAVQRIQKDSLRDSTAYKSALALLKVGQKRGAFGFVKFIKDNALQQKASAKLAKGDSSE